MLTLLEFLVKQHVNNSHYTEGFIDMVKNNKPTYKINNVIISNGPTHIPDINQMWCANLPKAQKILNEMKLSELEFCAEYLYELFINTNLELYCILDGISWQEDLPENPFNCDGFWPAFYIIKNNNVNSVIGWLIYVGNNTFKFLTKQFNVVSNYDDIIKYIK